MTLEEKLLDETLINLPDWQVAEILNTPSEEFPKIVSYKDTFIGYGTVMEVLGPLEGATLLENLETAAQTNVVLKYALRILEMANLNIGLPTTQEQLRIMIPLEQANKLIARAETSRLQSWAEYNNVEVTARTIGLARGGI